MRSLDTSPVTFDKSVYSVLIVEDSRFVNNHIYETMSAFGYDCHQAFSLQEAEIFFELSECRLIILDLHLPDGEGVDLIRKIQDLSKTKIVVLTSDTDIQLRNNLYQYGILDYFIKDEQLGHTLHMIDRLIQTCESNLAKSVMVIDSSSAVRQMMQTLLGARSFTVCTALSGTEGLQSLQRSPADLVVLDMQLPDMHATEVLKTIKSDPSLFSIPVLVLSGNHDPDIISRVYKLGACEFIKKPFCVEEMSQKINLWIDYNRCDAQMLGQQHFMQEYKNALDQSAIVTKFDSGGIITYVNEHICNLSGYDKKDLLGKHCSIIYDPASTAKISEALLGSSHKKGPWPVIIKNHTKEGAEFYTHTVINPITDIKGTVIEYIGISHKALPEADR